MSLAVRTKFPDPDVGTKGRVLVTDDDPDLLESLHDLLEADGYDVRASQNAQSALATAEAYKPDIVLIDVRLGRTNGVDLVPVLKQKFPEIVCIMMTAYAESQSAVQAMRNGADDYILKPLQPDELMRTLDRLIESRRLKMEAVEATRCLRESEQLVRGIMENVPDGMVTIDDNGRIESFNLAAERLFGFKAAEVVGKNVSLLMPHAIAAFHDRYIQRYLDTGRAGILGVGPREVRARCKNGSEFPMELAVSEMTVGGRRLFIGSMRDVTQRKIMEERLKTISVRDPLTGLANRALLHEQLSQLVEQAKRGGEDLAVIFVDLDDFKVVNDSLGHGGGDSLLQEAANRLRKIMRQSDIVARLGGDEFVVVSCVKRSEDASNIAEKIISSIAKPVVLQGESIFMSVSIGISTWPNDAEDAEALIRHADMAMYQAKESGKNAYRFFTPDMNEAAKERLGLVRRLRLGIERDQFFLEYQPQIDVQTGETIAIEALVRWREPGLGVIPPAKFVPIAEETGLIGLLGEWVLNAACTDAKSWQSRLPKMPRVAVNISGQQFRRSNLIAMVDQVLEKSGLDPCLLELEITESVFLRNLTENVAVLKALRQRGVRISIDDFGTGFSSLSYLKSLPIDALKIDRSFIREITTAKDSAAIVIAIISLAKSLDLDIVAEGVEEGAQLEFLRAEECPFAQGFLFARPMLAAEMLSALASDRSFHLGVRARSV